MVKRVCVKGLRIIHNVLAKGLAECGKRPLSHRHKSMTTLRNDGPREKGDGKKEVLDDAVGGPTGFSQARLGGPANAFCGVGNGG